MPQSRQQALTIPRIWVAYHREPPDVPQKCDNTITTIAIPVKMRKRIIFVTSHELSLTTCGTCTVHRIFQPNPRILKNFETNFFWCRGLAGTP